MIGGIGATLGVAAGIGGTIYARNSLHRHAESWVGIFVPGLLVSVVVDGVGGSLGIGVGTVVSASALR